MKKIMIGLGATAIVTLPLGASALAIPNPLLGAYDHLTQQFNLISQRLAQVKNEKLTALSDSLGKDLQYAVVGATGALGLPDLLVLREGIEGNAENSGGLYPNSTAANSVDRSVTRINSETTLSRSGQSDRAQTLLQTQQTVAAVGGLSQQANQEVATQEVLKRIAQQNELNAALLGRVAAEQVHQAQRDELANTNLANISESIDGQNQQRRSELMGAAMQNHRTSSFAGLF